ncbi:arylsulfate sulfotransferase [Levilactobacillus namurensis DSM 19117]|uniref:Arylsulfate sulfotransferase n=2 Tax=Levilactobacillus namurensis TaxID=380393 RepID=A0A0R1JXR4_9LACO|nr:arylsulfate sulfotransferase [Levilactobacillus namurensis DSM 19117]
MLGQFCPDAPFLSNFKEMAHVQRTHKRLWTLAVASLAILTVGLAGCSTKTKTTASYKIKENKVGLTTDQIKKNLDVSILSTRQDKQKSLTATYKAAAENKDYTFDNPYVKINPYGSSPLSALVTFTTDDAVKVSYTVVGKTDHTSITNTVKGGYTTSHQVPVVGLYADTNNTVKITETTKNGKTTTKTLRMQTGALPKYVKNATITVTNKDKDKMSIGKNKLTILNRTTKQPMAVDADGAVRWYDTNYSQHMVEQWSNGHIMILSKKDVNSDVYNDLLETDYLGRVYKEYSFSAKTSSSDAGSISKAAAKANPETTVIHHDLVELPNHNLLATVSDGSKYKEDTMIEVDHNTGKIVKVIDMKKILPKSMYKDYKKGADGKIDWLHQNAIDYDKNDKSIVISTRNQDMIMKLDYKTKHIKWIYSGKKKSSWPKAYRKYVLTPTKGTTITGGQHGLYLLNNGNGAKASSEDFMLYDNNIAVTNGNKKTSGKYSQAVQYHVNTKNMTIKQTWAYGKSLGKTNFTSVIGYAEKQPNGNVLIDFGYKNGGNESNVIEVTKSGKQVFNLTMKNAGSKAYAYRAYRVPFYDSAYQFDATK